jgi:thioredoxin-related protein
MSFVPLVLTVLATLGEKPPEPFRALDFDAAVKAARVEDKHILVVFGSTASADAKKLDTTTWTDVKVRSWLTATWVAIKLDVELDAELATRFRIHIVPTILILNRQGIEIDRITGYVDGRTFRAEADAILAGGDPVERVKKRMKGREDDPHLRIDLAGALIDRGLMEDAVKEYMWCWDHGLENDPSFAEARRAFLLGQIQRLGRLYPKANDLLAERAAKLSERVVDCAADDEQVADFLALERVQERDDAVLAAFDAIQSQSAECLHTKLRLAPIAIEGLIDARRYKEAVALMGDVTAHVSEILELAKRDLQHFEKERWGLAADTRLRKQRVDLARVYEALLGAERYDDADSLSKRILFVDSKGAMYTALIRAGLRAEAHGAARSIAVRAYGDPKLTDAEKLEIKSAARDILQPR